MYAQTLIPLFSPYLSLYPLYLSLYLSFLSLFLSKSDLGSTTGRLRVRQLREEGEMDK